MVLLKQINNIRIEKNQKPIGCKKKQTNGEFKTIGKRCITVYQATSPKGNVLYEAPKLKMVAQYARMNKIFVKRK